MERNLEADGGGEELSKHREVRENDLWKSTAGRAEPQVERDERNHADDERDEEEASHAEAERNQLEATTQGEEGKHEAARTPNAPAPQDSASPHHDHSAPSGHEPGETTAEVERQTAYGGRARWRMAVMRLGEDHGLSDREIEVLMLMGKGLNTRSISEVLSISYNTARTHVRNIYGKLGVHSRVELQQLIDGLRSQPGEQPEGE